jgi:hypothetical protein
MGGVPALYRGVRRFWGFLDLETRWVKEVASTESFGLLSPVYISGPQGCYLRIFSVRLKRRKN